MAGLKGSGRFQALTPQHASCRCCSPLITLAAVREEQLRAMGMADVSACLADLRERHASRFRVEAPPRRPCLKPVRVSGKVRNQLTKVL